MRNQMNRHENIKHLLIDSQRNATKRKQKKKNFTNWSPNIIYFRRCQSIKPSKSQTSRAVHSTVTAMKKQKQQQQREKNITEKYENRSAQIHNIHNLLDKLQKRSVIAVNSI